MTKTEGIETTRQSRTQDRLEDELAQLSAHMNAATARWLELVLEFRDAGGAAVDGLERWLAFRFGISSREARAYVHVAEALEELPAIREAFRRGELTFSKVRALTRVATPASDEALLELACALTASQLERALRVYRQVTSEEAGESHALEYVDYRWGEDGSLFLRARLPAEDGTLVVRALEAECERVRERRRAEQSRRQGTMDVEPPRPVHVEALVELAQGALSASYEVAPELPGLVVHVDAAALSADGSGRCELDCGPVIAAETARRLGCDAKSVTMIERDGIPVSVGRSRRTVPPKLRRLLEARDRRCCRWPGCNSHRYLHAHHRTHWARGGETSVENLVLLCPHHHRLVHEGGYTIEDGPPGELRFRNRHGVLTPSVPRSPPGSADQLVAQNTRAGLVVDPGTNRNGYSDPLELELAVPAIESALSQVS